MERKGTLLVLSGPSGAGKGTVLKEYLKTNENVFVSVSATTRAPREGEKHGVNYYYLTREEFDYRKDNNGLLEYTEYCDNYYGTPRKEVEEKLNAGVDVILEIEVDGGLQVKKNFPDAVLVFMTPPSYEELKRRLIGRGTETEDAIKKRLKRAEEEYAMAPMYDYIVINDTPERAASDLEAVFTAEKCKKENNLEFIKGVLNDVISGNC